VAFGGSWIGNSEELNFVCVGYAHTDVGIGGATVSRDGYAARTEQECGDQKNTSFRPHYERPRCGGTELRHGTRAGPARLPLNQMQATDLLTIETRFGNALLLPIRC
jgi:hypothetical protein